MHLELHCILQYTASIVYTVDSKHHIDLCINMFCIGITGSHSAAIFGTGTDDNTFVYEVQCRGNEDSLFDCQLYSSTSTQCNNDDNKIGISCLAHNTS